MSRLKPEMWGPLAAELSIPWRAAEAMHWQLGEVDMAQRAGVVPFSLSSHQHQQSSSSISSHGPPPTQYQIGPLGFSQPGSGYPPSGPSYSPLADAASLRPRTRTSSIGSQRDVGGTPILPALALSCIPQSSPSQGSLPSMAELERGLTSESEGRNDRPPSRR